MRALFVLVLVGCASSGPKNEAKSEPAPVAKVAGLCNSEDACMKGCTDGADEACERLLIMIPPTEDPHLVDKVRAVADKACAKGSMPVCARVASTWCDFDAEGLGACKKEGTERYRKACDAGIAFACFGLSGVYKRGGEGVEADELQAAKLEGVSKELFKRACDRDSVQDCVMLGSDKTAGLATAACDGGDALGCLAMADEDVPEHRAEWYGKACKLGFADACNIVNDIE